MTTLTMEYRLRLAGVDQPLYYAGSFYSVVDVLAIMPTSCELHSLHFAGFSGCKGDAILEHGGHPFHSLRASRRKGLVVLAVGMIVVSIIGSFMSLLEDRTRVLPASFPVLTGPWREKARKHD
jgi:voltage-gated potassium channel